MSTSSKQIVSNTEYINRHSIDYDGVNDYLNIQSTADIEFENNNTFSFSKWLRPHSTVAQKFYSGRSSTGNTQGLELFYSSQKYNFFFAATAALNIWIETQNTFQSNLWHHVCFTYDGSITAAGAKIYIDGAEQSVNVLSDNLAGTTVWTGDKKIGANTTVTLPMNGEINNFSIFKSALIGAQVDEIFNKRVISDYKSLSTVANLIHWWRMGANNNSITIPDEIGTLDGTMTNMSGLAITSEAP